MAQTKPAKPKKLDDQYTAEEAQCRFETALRGSRLAAPHPMKDFIGKGKRAAKGKGRVKKTPQAKPK